MGFRELWKDMISIKLEDRIGRRESRDEKVHNSPP